MSDTKQLAILKALTVHLEGITPANGYEHDLMGRVFRGKSKFGSEESLPFVSILESLRPDNRPLEAGPEKLIRLERWELLVQGWVDENREFPTDDLYQLKGAVEKRLAELLNTPENTPLYRLGGLIVSIRIGPGVVRAATPQVGGAEAFYLPLLVDYVMNLGDPFAL